MSIRRTVCAALALVCLAALAACGPKDPRQAVLDQRARWDLTPKGFLQKDDGRIQMTVGVAGPARSTIEKLTFRVELRDASGVVLAQVWRSVDLTAIPLGVGTDVMVDLGQPPEGFVSDEVPPQYGDIVIDLVPDPDAEEARHIEELQF